jgi:hypothetical protein
MSQQKRTFAAYFKRGLRRFFEIHTNNLNEGFRKVGIIPAISGKH